MGILGALEVMILYQHTEWIKSRSLTRKNYDSCLRNYTP